MAVGVADHQDHRICLRHLAMLVNKKARKSHIINNKRLQLDRLSRVDSSNLPFECVAYGQ